MAAGSKGGAITQASIVETVFEQVRCVAPADLVADLTLDTPLLEVGLDSLAQMDVVNRIESIFGVRFAEESLYDLETCRDLVVLIENTLARANGPARESVRESERVVEQVVPQAAAVFETASAGDVSSFPECLRFRQRLHDSAAAGLRNPFFRVSEGMRGATTTIAGQPVVNFTSFDYLGMARHPQVAAAAKNAIDQFGTSASASRLVGGNSTLLEDLDDELARFLGAEAVAVFPSGYGTNASLFGHLFGQDDLILYDELAHNSIVQGSLLSPARRRAFPHNDADYVDQLLTDVRDKYRRVVVSIEGVYSMDGDYPDLLRFVEVKNRHQALLYVDEAHSLGVMGATGRGICEHFGVTPEVGDLWMGTISKSLGSCGGYMAGRAVLVEYLKYTTPSFVFSTATPPSSAAAALAAIRLMQEEPERVACLRDRARLFLKLAQDSGLNTGNSGDTPIVPVILGDSRLCILVSDALLHQGINAQPILYPAVPESAARVRFFITAEHSEEQICRTVQVLSECVKVCRAAMK